MVPVVCVSRYVLAPLYVHGLCCNRIGVYVIRSLCLDLDLSDQILFLDLDHVRSNPWTLDLISLCLPLVSNPVLMCPDFLYQRACERLIKDGCVRHLSDRLLDLGVPPLMKECVDCLV